VGIEIYGGNQVVVAHFEEMHRVASTLSQAADQLELAIQVPQQLLFDLIPNPIPQIQLMFLLPGLIERARKLAFDCRLAADSYFSTEARVVLLMEQTLLPLSEARAFISDPNPISQATADVLTKTAAAMAVLGLTGKPTLGTNALVATASQLATTAAGYRSIPHMLGVAGANQQALGVFPDKTGSAQLLAVNRVSSAVNLDQAATKLQRSYGPPNSSIRVEVFSHGWGRQLVVYVPGTQSVSLDGSNPLNMRSTLVALGGAASAPSQTAVVDALNQLGAGPSDKVIFVGHSQGALISANLAKDHQDYEVSGLVSFGGPISHIDLKMPTIAVGHQGDPVPLLGGGVNPLRENWVTISAPGDFDDLVDAHSMAGYVETSKNLQTNPDLGLSRVSSAIWDSPEMSGLEYVFEIRRG
jgi:pimeloyl-ACP methyl ester carboxylesterase